MVNHNKLITRASIVFALVFSLLSFAQNPGRNDLSSFEGFKKLGFHASLILYNKAQTNKDYGNYKIISFPTLSTRLGFDYTFNHTKDWSFKTGFYLDLIPFVNSEFEILAEDLGFVGWLDDSTNQYHKLKVLEKWVFTLPVLYEGKLQMAERVFFSLAGGFDFTLLSSGGFEGSITYSNEEISKQVFGIYGDTADFWIYPSLRISPGLYFVTEKMLFQVHFSYKKSLVSYFRGEYQFGNLDVSEPTRGNHIITGDFIGLGLTIYFRKKHW